MQQALLQQLHSTRLPTEDELGGVHGGAYVAKLRQLSDSLQVGGRVHEWMGGWSWGRGQGGWGGGGDGAGQGRRLVGVGGWVGGAMWQPGPVSRGG